MAEKEALKEKEKDVGQVVRYLTSTFNKATVKLDRAFRGKDTGPNKAYALETEFAYLLNEVVQGPRCVLQKNIAECNDFIDRVITELGEEQSAPTK